MGGLDVDGLLERPGDDLDQKGRNPIMALTREQYEVARKRALGYYEKAGIVLNDDEKARLEVADFGLENLEQIGLQITTYINTDRCCAKELVLFPWQICPEHRHPAIGNSSGKEETFRCRWGEVYLYVEGPPAPDPKAKVPQDRNNHLSVWNEIVLLPGDQYTLQPNTLHWFQGGPEGAVVSEFSTASVDEEDVFTDPDIARIPVVE
jgi:D-lyxose ketol-isomerase